MIMSFSLKINNNITGFCLGEGGESMEADCPPPLESIATIHDQYVYIHVHVESLPSKVSQSDDLLNFYPQIIFSLALCTRGSTYPSFDAEHSCNIN